MSEDVDDLMSYDEVNDRCEAAQMWFELFEGVLAPTKVYNAVGWMLRRISGPLAVPEDEGRP